MKVPFLHPDIRRLDIKRMVSSIKTGWLVHGEQTKILEEKLKDYLKAEDVVMTGSCTAALHISLMLAGVKPGDEVITTPMSWVATSNVILHRGAKVVFVDVDKETGLIDLNEVEKKITKKTKAIIPVHYCGEMVNMKKLDAIARKHKIKIIEDSAHALESYRDGIRPGQLGFSSCLSFHVAKNITSGQGGAFVTNDKELGRKARILRRDGVINSKGKRVMIMLGDKFDSTDFQATLLVGQLDRIKDTHRQRRLIFDHYAKAFTKAGIEFLHYKSSANHACHMFTILVNPRERDQIRADLATRGVETSIHYTPIHLEPYYRKTFGYKEGDYPNAEWIGASTITLPTYSKLTKVQQDFVIASINSSLNG
ncbi:hypothetical protein A3F19_02770 [Candidatus Nomurabacteria bacterium RIFCSPHIGHO2_12_FULL_37_29]|nr:MAG: hypothetical protein A3F19_02770 [Candidatus Nomurabacteria bacterium RIFCSPHIGHO2_12_FULL_37_29]